jgi:putative ABC transport system permease protein
MGTNLLQIMAARAGPRGPQSRFVRITTTDLVQVHAGASYAAAVSGVGQGTYTVVGPAGDDDITVTGVEPPYIIIKNRSIADGGMFGQDDLDERARVAVLGATAARTLFGTVNNIVGQSFRIGDQPFTVAGVLAAAGTSGGVDQDELVWAPLTTYLTRLANTTNLSNIQVSVADKRYMSAEERELKAILRESHKLADGAPDDFSIMNSADMIDTANEILRTMTTLLGAIAGVSLLVGGIGIMNIMLVSVTERTREIGIRMAVGARKRDILAQFLSEAVFLSLAGGALGVGLAFGVCAVLGRFNVATYISPGVALLAAAFSAFVGVFFGFYPAQKAAKLYPIDALRYE